MNIVLLIVLILLLVYIIPQNVVYSSSRIVGGHFCNNTKYSFVVALYPGCGGSLISLHWVLTAAHCIHLDVIKRKLGRIRSGYNFSKEFIQERRMKLAIIHKKYNDTALRAYPPELRYDIALILADRPFEEMATLSVIALAPPGFTQTCHIAKTLGTGSEGEIKNSPSMRMRLQERPLQCVDLHLVETDICNLTYPGSIIDDSLVCTMERQWGKDACQGDSGGPLICEGKEYMVLIGVVSYGLGCGYPNLSATYTKVESYLQFINDTIIEYKKYETRISNSNGDEANLVSKIVCNFWQIIISFFLVRLME